MVLFIVRKVIVSLEWISSPYKIANNFVMILMFTTLMFERGMKQCICLTMGKKRQWEWWGRLQVFQNVVSKSIDSAKSILLFYLFSLGPHLVVGVKSGTLRCKTCTITPWFTLEPIVDPKMDLHCPKIVSPLIYYAFYPV